MRPKPLRMILAIVAALLVMPWAQAKEDTLRPFQVDPWGSGYSSVDPGFEREVKFGSNLRGNVLRSWRLRLLMEVPQGFELPPPVHPLSVAPEARAAIYTRRGDEILEIISGDAAALTGAIRDRDPGRAASGPCKGMTPETQVISSPAGRWEARFETLCGATGRIVRESATIAAPADDLLQIIRLKPGEAAAAGREEFTSMLQSVRWMFPRDPKAQNAFVKGLNGSPATALKEFDRSLAAEKDLWFVLGMKAWVLAEMEGWDRTPSGQHLSEARSAAERALELVPLDFTVRRLLFEIALRQPDPALIRKLSGEVLALYPDAPLLRLNAGLAADITGDGVPDRVRLEEEKGGVGIEALDGAAGKTLWTSSCRAKGWAVADRLERVQVPALRDVNGDGAEDLIFVAEGCGDRSITALDRKRGEAIWRISVTEKWNRKDLVVAGDLLLVARKQEDESGAGSPDADSVLAAFRIRDGFRLWEKPLDLRVGNAWTGYPRDVYMIHEGPKLWILPRDQPTSTRLVGSVGKSVTTQAKALMALADTPRLAVSEGRVFYAEARRVRAFNLADGVSLWDWSIPTDLMSRDTVVSADQGTLLVLALSSAGDATDASMASLDAASGRLQWQKQVKDLYLPQSFFRVLDDNLQITTFWPKGVWPSMLRKPPCKGQGIVLSRRTGETLQELCD